MIRYISGVDTAGLREVADLLQVGLMIQPGNSYWMYVHAYPMWCADNGCFTTKKDGFPLWDYLRMLQHDELQKHKARCLFVAAPDVLIVAADGTVTGDAAATLNRFPLWQHVIRSHGFPVALVAQDGLETMLDAVPWDDLDVLFIGGSTEWKLGDGARRCVLEARRRGKRTHMGRVNSLRRMRIAQSFGIDTADGTFLKYGPVKNLPRLKQWLDALRKDDEISTST